MRMTDVHSCKNKRALNRVQEPKNSCIHLHRFVGSRAKQITDRLDTGACVAVERLLKLGIWGFFFAICVNRTRLSSVLRDRCEESSPSPPPLLLRREKTQEKVKELQEIDATFVLQCAS